MERTEFLQKIQTTIADNNLFTKEDAILVGVSGGVDSMTLIQSLYELGYSVAIAHCNFKLRNAESDGDQDFVVNYANANKIPIHVCSFDTKTVAQERKVSVEMAARDLRYEWFDMVCRLNNYTRLAIAHNQNDSIETFFINLLRSAGIKGLTGIPMRNGQIVRPLLNVSRAEIEEFARQSLLSYRVDSTNLGTDYMRNKIRNIILPELQQIAPNCIDAITTSMSHIQEGYAIYQSAIESARNECCQIQDNGFVIREDVLMQQERPQTLLFEFLYPYGFNPDVIQQILNSFSSQSGKRFESETYIAVHDRNRLFVERKSAVNTDEIVIDAVTKQVEVGGRTISFAVRKRADFTLRREASVASLDMSKLQFPLVLRTWKNGDSFVPFGMKGRKKISDFLIDEKIPLSKKSQVQVLVSNDEIVWVVGLRISQIFAIDEGTEEVYECIIHN